MAPRYHAESGSIIPKMRPVRSSSNLKTKHLPMKLPLVGSVMLPDTTLSVRRLSALSSSPKDSTICS